MKLRIGNSVFLQKYEIAHITHDLNSFPASFISETFDGLNNNAFFMCGPIDALSFDCVYKQPENVEWIMEQDWIIDFEEYAKMSLDELKAAKKRFETEHLADVDDFNSKDLAYRKAHFDEESDKLSNSAHKAISLMYMIELLEGKTSFDFPNKYKDKSKYCAKTTKKRSNFFSRLFKRGAQ